MSDELQLNPFAQRFKTAFASAFPDWADHICPYQKWCGPEDPLDECYYLIPNPRGQGSLDVATWRGAIRVSFERFRRSWQPGEGVEDAALGDVILFVRALVDESIVIVYRKSLLYVFDKNFNATAVPSFHGQFEQKRGFLASRSWHGTYNLGTLPERVSRS